MNEPAISPAPEPIETTLETAPSSPPERARYEALPWLCGIGFLILAAAIVYLWVNMNAGDQVGSQAKEIQSIYQRMSELDSRLGRMEQRPAPVVSAGDLARLNARLDALDGRLVNQAQVASQVDSLSGRIQALAGRDQSAIDQINQQVADISNRIKAMATAAGDLTSVTARVERLAKLQAAATDLAAGLPLGDLADAPQVLSKYAQTAPPTVAQLRLSFRQAKISALTKPEPSGVSAPFVDRVWEKAQGLLTIRQGDTVVVGDATAMTLNQAEILLDAGDVAGAVKSLNTLKGGGAAAMAGWLTSAKDLLEARSALAKMAAQN